MTKKITATLALAVLFANFVPTAAAFGPGGGGEMNDEMPDICKMENLDLSDDELDECSALETMEEKTEYLTELGIEIPERGKIRERGGEKMDGDPFENLDLTDDEIAEFELLETMEEKMEYLEELGIEMPEPGENKNGTTNREREVNGRKINLENLDLTDDEIAEFELLETAEERKAFLEELGIEIPENQNDKSDRFSDEGNIRNLTAVNFLQKKGIVDGYADGTFQPENEVNRAEAMKMILEAIGEEASEIAESSFEDVDANEWYAEYVERAKELGFVDGYADGTFRPGQTVNKVELLKMLLEAFEVDVSTVKVDDLFDDTPTDAWYAAYLQFAKDAGIVVADEDGLFNPADGMNRDDFADVIYKLMEILDLVN